VLRLSWNEKLPLSDPLVGIEEGILLRFFPCYFRVILLGYRVIFISAACVVRRAWNQLVFVTRFLWTVKRARFILS
jgi:hypothetical protein